MKTYPTTTILALLLFIFAGCSPQGRSEPPKNSQQIVIVISPSLPDRANLLAIITTWLMHQANVKVQIFDGSDGTQITEFIVPQVKYFKPGAVADRIGAPLQKLIAWNQETAGDPRLIGTGALALPEVLDRIAQRHSAPARLLLIGSPVYRSPGNREYDFSEPRFRYPSLGYLNDATFPFSCNGRERTFASTRVYYLFPKENTAQWPTSYEENLRKFYGALVAKRGGVLVSFTPDLAAGLQVVATDAKSPLDEMPAADQFATVRWSDAQAAPSPAVTNSPQPKLAAETNGMGSPPSLTRAADNQSQPVVKTNSSSPIRDSGARARDPIAKGEVPKTPTRESVVTTTAPPQVVAAPAPQPTATNLPVFPSQKEAQTVPNIPQAKPGVTVVMRYKSDSDAGDLYVRPHHDADEISFRQPATSLGTYNYQFDFASSEHVKSIHLPGGCDPAKAEIWVNYASGFGRMAGRIIWLTPGGQSESPFSFVALKGGASDYKWESRRRKSEYWQRINPFDFTVGKAVSGTSKARPVGDQPSPQPGQPELNGTPVK